MTFTAGGGTEYEFFVNGTSVQGPDVMDTYTTPDLMDGDAVTVTATDGNGCTDTHVGITMMVSANPVSTLMVTDSTTCAGDTVTFTAGGGTEYEFFVNGTSVQGPDVMDTYTTPDLMDGDAVTVTVTDGNGCTDTHTGITMMVSANPVATLMVTDSTTCAGDTVTFTAGGGTEYEFFVNGTSVQGPDVMDTYTTPDLMDGDAVTVTVTDGNGCTDTHAGITMMVSTNPVATLMVTDSTTCAGDTVTFTAGGGTEYEFFVNGTSVQGPDVMDTYTTPDLMDGDAVTVTATDGNGCTDTLCGHHDDGERESCSDLDGHGQHDMRRRYGDLHGRWRHRI